jgi:hypothetical protein
MHDITQCLEAEKKIKDLTAQLKVATDHGILAEQNRQYWETQNARLKEALEPFARRDLMCLCCYEKMRMSIFKAEAALSQLSNQGDAR